MAVLRCACPVACLVLMYPAHEAPAPGYMRHYVPYSDYAHYDLILEYKGANIPNIYEMWVFLGMLLPTNTSCVDSQMCSREYDIIIS